MTPPAARNARKMRDGRDCLDDDECALLCLQFREKDISMAQLSLPKRFSGD